MKKLSLILISFFFAFAACENNSNVVVPDDEEIANDSIVDDSTTNDDTPVTDNILWEYKIDAFSSMTQQIRIDNNDNTYFIGKPASTYILYSLNKLGELNWKFDIPSGQFPKNYILTDNKVILSAGYDNIIGLNITDGSVAWQINFPSVVNVSMAYNNSVLYLAEYDNDNSFIKAVDTNNGNIKWEKDFNIVDDAKISVSGQYIAIVSDVFLANSDIARGIKIIKDLGTDASEEWSFYKKRTTSDYIVPTAIFDNLGNVFYSDMTDFDSTNVYSFNLANGSQNWKTRISNFNSDYSHLLYTNGKLYASYINQSWSDIAYSNSIAQIDASNVAILHNNEEILIWPHQMLLTGSANFVLYDFNIPGFVKYDANMNHLSTYEIESADIDDMRINSEGNLIVQISAYPYGSIVCYKSDYAAPAANTWNTMNGNNANTNTLK
jgi:hypothetical protein